MPFFLRHYLSIADKVVVQDCGSTDNTRAIVQHYGADYIDSGTWGMDERRRRDDAQDFMVSAAGKCEWIIAPDADEFVLGNFGRALDDAAKAHCDVLQTVGWTMHGSGLPEDDGQSQIYELSNLGERAGASKPIVVRSGGDFLWSAGKHFIETNHSRVAYPILSLLHYRYMGYHYTKERNSRNYERSIEKATALTCSPNWKGHESAESAEKYKTQGVNVMEAVRKIERYEYITAYAPHLDHSKMIMP